MEPLTFYFVLIVSILGISFAGYKEWLKFQAKQREMGVSSEMQEHIQSLRDRLTKVEQERDALRTRVQNLETIVTSESWDALQAPSSDPDALDSSTSPTLTSPPSDESSSTERAEALARRLRS